MKKNSPSSIKPFITEQKPPRFYTALFVTVVGLSIAGVTWIFKSGAIMLWDRHPGPATDYEFGWALSLLIGIPGGFMLGALLMSYFLQWYEGRHDGKDT
jgi:hypothetical protein